MGLRNWFNNALENFDAVRAIEVGGERRRAFFAIQREYPWFIPWYLKIILHMLAFVGIIDSQEKRDYKRRIENAKRGNVDYHWTDGRDPSNPEPVEIDHDGKIVSPKK